MVQLADPISLSIPRSLLSDISQLSSGLTDRMHELLEKNTDGMLGAQEKAELESRVRIAEFGQIISMALQRQSAP
jgi:hypothetical protein